MTKIHSLLLFSLLTVLSLAGCHGNVNSKSENVDGGTFSIDLDKELSKEVSLFDFCDGVEFRVLDDSQEAMMESGTICCKALGDTSIFFLSRADHLIREFDYDGNLLRVVNRFGRGPGEFTMANDMLINKYTNTLDILNPQGIIYQYSLDSLVWKNTIDIDFAGKIRAVHYFHLLSPGKYILCSITESPQLYIYSAESGLEDVDIDNVLPEWVLATSFSAAGNPIYEIGGEVKFTTKFDGSIYTLDGTSMKPQYKWDMGEHQIELSQVEANQEFFYYRKLAQTISNKYAINFNRLAESERYVIQNFKYKDGNNSWESIVLDKTDKTLRVFKKTKENVVFLAGPVKDDSMYHFTDPEYVDFLLNESLLNDEKSLEAYRSLTDDSNMVLIKYHLKK